MADVKIRVTDDAIEKVDADALILNWFTEDKGSLPAGWKSLDGKLGGDLATSLKGSELRGSLYEVEPVHTGGNLKVRRIFLIGAGSRATFGVMQLRNVAAAGARAARNRGAKRVVFALEAPAISAGQVGQAIADGALTGPLEPDLYRTVDREERRLTDVTILTSKQDKRAVQAGAERGERIAAGVNFTRGLAEEPANVMTPLVAAERAQAMAKEVGLDCEVLDDKALEKLNMRSLLSVALGSQWPARVVVLSYRGDRGSKETFGFVGKGVTFDSGGISIKGAENMHHMKYDMGGAAAVIGAMRAIAQLKPKANVIGVVGFVENMPSGTANKPGDVVRAANGKTIEILNTDAEGRLVLADCLHLARQRGATKLVDAATLTGAVVVALGNVATGVLGAPQSWVDTVLAAFGTAGERGWQLPLFPEYKEQIKSPIADIANTGGRGAGTITAALFLQNFVDDTPWAHLDIAGTGWNERDVPYLAKGATGAAVRSFVELASPSTAS
ncbi:MAG TPA: leucyl aminopeptidase [Chloroflexia bacterium]|nr:leucyl aminopeptidase [Chloroflexia bacterium]